MSENAAFRVYTPDELGEDGYPLAWHGLGDQDAFALKRLARADADYRCVRCHHPFMTKSDARILGVEPSPGEWSPCDPKCSHLGPVRWRPVSHNGLEEWREQDLDRIGHPAGEGILDYDSSGAMVERYEVEAKWRVLTVHHLDGDKANCRWWNLAALCQRCHLTIQGKVRMDRPWPWPHSEWMRPYVAGFYAFKYLGGVDLTRAEVDERLDEILTVGAREEAAERMPV